MTAPNMTAADAATNNVNKEVLFKSYTPFNDCISEINNTQVDNANYIDVIMLMKMNIVIIEYSDNYSKTSESL